jgi:hypothetical protein
MNTQSLIEVCGSATLWLLGSRRQAHFLLEHSTVVDLMPNVRAKLPAEAGLVSPVRDDSTTGADRAYKACRSGSA